MLHLLQVVTPHRKSANGNADLKAVTEQSLRISVQFPGATIWETFAYISYT